MIPHRKRTLGLLQLTTGAVMISFSPVYVKLAHVGPITAGFYRMLFGGILLSAIVWIRGERLSHGPRSVLVALAGSIFLALDTSFWHWSIRYVGPGLATLLANFQVFFPGRIRDRYPARKIDSETADRYTHGHVRALLDSGSQLE